MEKGNNTHAAGNTINVRHFFMHRYLRYLFLALLCSLLILITRVAGAKVYIDITSPAFTKFPIAINDFSGESGDVITDIIRNDLAFSGLFDVVDKAAFLEKPAQQFNPRNWTPLGIDAVVKGSVKADTELVIIASLFDVVDGKEIFRKEYKAEKDLLRPLAHSVSNDIYATLTGKPGMFRSKIAFVAGDAQGKSIHIMDWDGYRTIKTGLKGNIILAPRWSKEGTKIVYSAEKNRRWGIYLLDFMNMVEKKIYSAPGTHIVGDFFPGGTTIALSSSKKGTPDIYSMDIQNASFTELSSSHGIEVSPAVSPDGKFIAFVSDKGGSPQIYIMRADGTQSKRITFEGSYNTSPSWSPKGDKIVFSGRRGTNQIFTINPDGTGLTQLTQDGNNEDPSFSPNGMHIAFCSDRDGGKGIYIMRADGEAQQKITPHALQAASPRWSPN
jgi:TolB protein